MITLPQLHAPPPPDNCGPCNACCDVVGVDALGKPYYARCPHLRCASTTGGCGIYATRPHQCSEYRCAWHLGLLGPRTDRRPLECGVLFQFEQERGRWRLSAYETRPGALLSEVHLTPYGADVPVLYPVADLYDYRPPPRGIPTRPLGQMRLWDGGVRELLLPRPSGEP